MNATRVMARWPAALAVACAAGAVTVIVVLAGEVDLFGPVVVTMAGIYVVAFALRRPWTAWVALAALSTVVAVLQVLRLTGALPVSPAVAMCVVVLLALGWAVAARRWSDPPALSAQAVGVVVFGAVTLGALALAPRWGIALLGLAFLAHAGWDAYHFRANRVVHRSYAEFCGVVDVIVGPALLIAALA